MKLYLVSRKGLANYDENQKFVIRAKSPKHARAIAAESKGDEMRDVWLNSGKSDVKVLKHDGEARVIISDYHQG